MIWSTYKQYIVEGGTSSLCRCLHPPSYAQERVPMFDWNHFSYHRLLKYYHALFGQERVLALPYELSYHCPSEFASRILRFADLPINEDAFAELPYSQKVYPSFSGLMSALRRHLNVFIQVRNRFYPHVIFPVPWGMNQKLNRLFHAVDRCLPTSLKIRYERQQQQKVVQFTGDRYRESNQLTNRLLADNLADYEYDGVEMNTKKHSGKQHDEYCISSAWL